MAAAATAADDDGGMALVRIKPLGAGGGGVEASASEDGEVGVVAEDGGVAIVGGGARKSVWAYPKHVIGAEQDNVALYAEFMPRRVDAFLEGTNVNIMCYGQTGSGKTHTMPPGIMARAAAGAFGSEPAPEFGLCPRGLLDICVQLEQRRQQSDTRYLLTASAVELTVAEGNIDMFSKAEVANSSGALPDQLRWFSGANGSVPCPTVLFPSPLPPLPPPSPTTTVVTNGNSAHTSNSLHRTRTQHTSRQDDQATRSLRHDGDDDRRARVGAGALRGDRVQEHGWHWDERHVEPKPLFCLSHALRARARIGCGTDVAVPIYRPSRLRAAQRRPRFEGFYELHPSRFE